MGSRTFISALAATTLLAGCAPDSGLVAPFQRGDAGVDAVRGDAVRGDAVRADADLTPALGALKVRAGTNWIDLAVPFLSAPGSPRAKVTAYIGVDGTVSAANGAVRGSIEGPVDVSSRGHRFATLVSNTAYRIIVVARNPAGYAVREVKQATAPGSCPGGGDETPACAKPIKLGAPIHSSLSAPGDVDFYSLVVTDTEGTYTFLTFDLGPAICSVDTTLAIFGPGGKTVVKTNDNASTVQGPVPDPCSAINGAFSSPGTYYIRVASSATGRIRTGNYTLRATFAPDYIKYPSGVLSHWKADKAKGPLTDSNSAHTMAAADAVPSVVGRFGRARGPFGKAHFTNSHPDFGGKHFMIELFMKSSDSVNLQGLVGNFRWSGGSRSSGLSVRISRGRLTAIFADGVGSSYEAITTANVFDGKWHHVVVARIDTTDAVKVRVYVDGVHRREADTKASGFLSSAFMTIGSYHDNLDRPYLGQIDDVVYWNKPPKTWAAVDAIVARRWNKGAPKPYK